MRLKGHDNSFMLRDETARGLFMRGIQKHRQERGSQTKLGVASRTAAVALFAWAGCVGVAAADQAPAASTPAPTPMANPSMSASISANPNPATFDAGPFGHVTIDGVISGIAFSQSHPAGDFFGNLNKDGYGDLSNATLILNKSDGVLQYYMQVGAYSLPALGSPYYRASTLDKNLFGFFQQGYLRYVPNSTFNIEVGALPTLVGDEYSFTFENLNIERGLLWNQEPLVSKGVQANFSLGQWSGALSWNDGFYTDHYTSGSASLTYTFKNSDTLTGVAAGNFQKFRDNTFVSPVTLANSQMYNVIYTHTQGPWVISPYIQYTSVPNVPGWTPSGSTIGAAILAKYSFTPQLSLSARAEYISSSGKANLLYGPKSDAWSVTLTPSYQQGVFFVRGEASYVSIGSGTTGAEFGANGAHSDQVRFMLETGLVF
jgi:hypothetical protein